jgi:trehalose synthase
MTLTPQEVRAPPLSPLRFKELLDADAWEEFEDTLARARRLFEGRVVWNVNSTAQGGGVAEMLRSFVSYSRGADLDVRWMVIEGTPKFFEITKRLHNFLHGEPGDGGELGTAEREVYDAVTAENAEQLAAAVRPDDIVILHDPQTAGLVTRMSECGAVVVWRSHVGAEEPNDRVRAAWDFLAHCVEHADACVFSRRAYVPHWAVTRRTMVIQPSIDAFSPKNQDLDRDAVLAILAQAGLVAAAAPDGVMPTFTRYDGTPGRVDRPADVLRTGPPPPADTPLVTQVSRWDRLKDPMGVMMGFAEHVADTTDAHLVLAGPSVSGVADDPEGGEVLGEVEAAWAELPLARRRRVHLACLPMADIDENAAVVNALQRHSAVIVQKSIQEGFGLTVAEGMWKARPVVASAVGGIKDQIVDGETGVMLGDPYDLAAFGGILVRLLGDGEERERLGRNAREHVRRNFLANRHARQYVELLEPIVAEKASRPVAAKR